MRGTHKYILSQVSSGKSAYPPLPILVYFLQVFDLFLQCSVLQTLVHPAFGIRIRFFELPKSFYEIC